MVERLLRVHEEDHALALPDMSDPELTAKAFRER
jgi:hypothetical protein